MTTQTPLKDTYNQDYVEQVSRALKAAWPQFDAEAFGSSILDADWDAFELKGRMLRLAEVIDDLLPDDFEEALAILDPVVPQFGGYHAMFFPAIVERRVGRDFDGLWNPAVRALARYTAFSSSEFAVRPMIVADEPRMLNDMLGWTQSDCHHVRRLASEGCRPRLPWANALPSLKRDPTPLLPILEALRDDATEYVRRSVANNLNDIAKDHPERVLDIAGAWLAGAPDDRNRHRLVKHACRTLLKAGAPRAMSLFGFRDPAHLDVRELTLDSPTVLQGGELEFRFRLTGKPSLGRVRLEYVVHYRKANGRLSPKIFRISEFDGDESVRDVSRRHAFRDLSTRRHYAGDHELAVHVNGVEKARIGFVLKD